MDFNLKLFLKQYCFKIKMKSKDNEMIRADLIFSYWIFVWWILYELNLTTANPKFVIILGIIHNFIFLLIKIYKKSDSILPFIIINFCIKIIPIISLLNTTIQYNDIIITVYLFLVYLVWLIINYKTIIMYNEKNAIPPFEHFFKKNILQEK